MKRSEYLALKTNGSSNQQTLTKSGSDCRLKWSSGIISPRDLEAARRGRATGYGDRWASLRALMDLATDHPWATAAVTVFEEEVMRKFVWGAFLVLCLMAGSSPACAMDCAKAYLPVDFIICSDPTLLRVNKADEQAWRETRARLNDAEKQELLADQRRWLKEYPPRCGVPAQGKLLATIPKEAQERVAKALGERTAFLEQYHNPAAEARGTFEIQNGERSNLKQSADSAPMPVQPVESNPRLRQATFSAAAAGNVDIQGWCRRSGTSVICPLMITNNDPTQGVSFRDERIYDRESRNYSANKTGLADKEGWEPALLLHGLPAKGFFQFGNVPQDVSEIERMEFTVITQHGGESRVVIESPIPIGE